MSDEFPFAQTQSSAWTDAASQRASADPMLRVDVDGFAGPLDLLLELARRQKVDLAKISILALAEQYLEFVAEARRLRIELAADYLVMAAYLAYLKSRLLLPELEADDEADGEELAAHLAFRLQRLAAMREAAGRLMNRNRLGRDFFARGLPEPIVVDSSRQYSATLYDLLSAYAVQRQRAAVSHVTIAQREVWSLQEAKDLLTKLVGDLKDWTPLTQFLVDYLPDPRMRTSVLASSFAASLEMAREGSLALRQQEAFAPIFLKQGRRRGTQAEVV